MAKRAFDLLLCLVLILPVTLLTGVLVVLVRLTSPGPGLHWSHRVGRHNRVFRMAKLRTMSLNAPDVATHLLADPNHVTPLGSFLRKTSLDELPQIFNVVKGEMSFVGPRPALYNQYDLVQLRTEKNVHGILPGVTGLAQVNGRDEIGIPQKVDLDARYLREQSLCTDLKIIAKTLVNALAKKNISH